MKMSMARKKGPTSGCQSEHFYCVIEPKVLDLRGRLGPFTPVTEEHQAGICLHFVS